MEWDNGSVGDYRLVEMVDLESDQSGQTPEQTGQIPEQTGQIPEGAGGSKRDEALGVDSGPEGGVGSRGDGAPDPRARFCTLLAAPSKPAPPPSNPPPRWDSRVNPQSRCVFGAFVHDVFSSFMHKTSCFCLCLCAHN